MSEEKKDPEPFALYVAHVPGHTVPRYGHPGHYLGVELQQPHGWKETHRVEALSHAEVAKYSAEYTRHIRDKELRKCSRAEYEASVKKDSDAHAKRAAGEKAALEKATAPSDEPTPSPSSTDDVVSVPVPDTQKKNPSSR